ncbi:hypothetical protein MYAM1_004057 [Malassezia yamatoensis]|uniref:Uncharacterized protein n=1 Tax=Malassezia yamatoensis TaxID=253288 RepID=A0AAJ6CIT6_9BASI|nr:hypothetical protein MYAM1_004057 [Malassezia yamatoensis]
MDSKSVQDFERKREDEGNTIARTIAWVLADADVGYKDAVQVAAKLSERITGQEATQIEGAFVAERPVDWHVSNAYYEADLQMCFGRYSDYKAAPAMVLLVRDDASLSQHRQTLQQIDRTGFDFDISIVIGLFSNSQGTEFGETDEMYAQQGWEYLRFPAGSDEPLEKRLRDAFMANTWDGLQLHDTKGAKNVSDAQDDGDYGEFVQAHTDIPDAHEVRAVQTAIGLTDNLGLEEQPVVFDRLLLEMKRVKALPVGPEKQHQAALLAMAIEQMLLPMDSSSNE